MTAEPAKDLGTTDTGIKPNVAALLAYLIGFVTGLIFLLIEKQNKFVRFHALQSILVFGGLFVALWVVSLIPVIGAVLNGLLSLLAIALWVVLMVKAFRGEMFQLPFVGEIAQKRS